MHDCQIVATSSNIEKAQTKNWYSKVSCVEFDLHSNFDHLNLFEYFGKPDLLIHLAWEGLPNYLDQFHVENNLPRHQRFLYNLISNGLNDLTVSGTCLEYGMMNGCLNESLVVDPSNPYAIAKNSLRLYLESLFLDFDFCMKWVRLFYMYGEGQSPKSLISLLDKAIQDKQESFNMSGGLQIRDFLPVNKVSAYFVAIALQNKITGIINCCSGVPVTVKDFVENYLSVRNQTIHLNLGFYEYATYEPMEFWGDNTKLKSIIKE